jgi:patatin-like phospholipase/acyl hydrolase
MGKSAEAITKVFLVEGESIFPRGEAPKGRLAKWMSRYRMWNAPKYDGLALRKAIEDVVGSGTRIGDAKTRLLIPAVNMSKGSVQMFKTAHHHSLVLDRHLNAADVAMATSAAPLFFPMAKVGDSYFVDGGIVANAPDMCAIHEAVRFLDQKQEDIQVLSIGTTTTRFSLPSSLTPDMGARDWLANQRLTSTVSSAQQQLVDYMVGHQLGDRYIRIDEIPSAEQSVDLGLDLATKARRGTLLGLAEGRYQAFAGDERVRAMLRHQPAAPTFYN